MAKEVRRDNKGRILRTGESQRPDGRYMFKSSLLAKPLYSWKLVPTDKIPKGKRNDISLRDKIEQALKDVSDGIDPAGKKLTVCQLYAKKNSLRKNVKRNTVKGRQQFMNLLKKDALGSMTIDNVKLSDAKAWAIRMSENGIAYNSIRNYKRSLKASFYLAIQDDYIRKNPFDFKLSEVIDDDTEEKIVLTPEQEENLLSFAKTDKTYKKYYDEIVILLETGLRVSELCGLDLNVAVNMKDRLILVEHQLLRDNEVGYYTAPPKTKNGSRQVPMSNRAYEAFKRAIKNRPKGKEFMVDGYSRFLFLNKKGLPKVAVNYDGMLRGLVAKYNKTHDEPLPHITPHTFRHTFCTNMANKGMNPNTLQYIIGHSNITMTLGYYAHGSYASAKSEMDRLCA
ncbi:tyrosine-type recombinase/integrase [Massilimicrobiota timonensis]|uniref:Site-specific integrase n=1 Tax=Massilimicrobiota timonensis TaxID=1776392 RepID=A0A1Y4T653_9FIRM|nr:tyrosine-type recombinase/integrase [Massilimicrobiota timonensis]OUQ36433.1 site-specific integrase [Massilimicrobiota timonensis]